VAQVVIAAGYEAFFGQFSTDHRAYFIDLDTDKLFGASMQPLVSPAIRRMQSTNVKKVTQYLREKSRQLQQCNAFAGGKQLTMPGHCHSFAEGLDKDVLQISLSAVTIIKKYKSPAWSLSRTNQEQKCALLPNVYP
jgi:hypothetical protein